MSIRRALTTLSDTSILVAECPNCHTPLNGQFCFLCGQNQKGFDRFFLSLIKEAFDDIFATDSRAAKTIYALILKPGFLTREYFAGRRARYVQPIRLYFITSLAFFFLLSVLNAVNPESRNISIKADADIESGFNIDSDDTDIEDFLAFLSEEQSSEIDRKVAKLKQQVKEDPSAIMDKFIEMAPPVMFCLLPIFACLLKLAYINTDRYYTEHLVLAVHNHCFIYLTLLTISLVSIFASIEFADGFETLVDIGILVYLYVSIKSTYGEGWLLTTFKYFFLLISYGILLLLGIIIAGIIGFLQL